MTRREKIEELLKKREYSAYELSKILDTKLKTITEDLKHVAKSKKGKFKIIPAICKDCGFVFREKIGKPSKCPKCRGERISWPKFRIENEQSSCN